MYSGLFALSQLILFLITIKIIIKNIIKLFKLISGNNNYFNEINEDNIFYLTGDTIKDSKNLLKILGIEIHIGRKPRIYWKPICSKFWI